jgi:membrane protease subunit (stomatin/prohibitin family)
MNIVGDLNQYAKFQAAESLPIAAANEGGGLAGAGVGLGAGLTMAQQMMNALKPESSGGPSTTNPVPPSPPPSAAPAGETKFCQECGNKIPRSAKFCPECGKPQA